MNTSKSIWKQYKVILPMMSKHYIAYLIGALTLLVTISAQMINPQFIKRGVDQIYQGDFSYIELMQTSLLVVGVALFIFVSRFTWRNFIIRSANRVAAELRDKLFEHILTLDKNFYNTYKVGDVMARVNQDVDFVKLSLGWGFTLFIDAIFSGVFVVGILIWQYPGSYVWMTPMFMMGGILLMLGPWVRKRFRIIQKSYSRICSESQEIFSGIRVIKSFSLENYMHSHFQHAIQGYMDNNLKLVRIWGMMTPLGTFIIGCTTLIVLLLAGQGIIEGSLTPGDISAIFIYISLLTFPVMNANMTINLLQKGAASLDRINEILDKQSEIKEDENPIKIINKGDISIRNLSFAYNKNDSAKDKEQILVLNDISLDVPIGKNIGILGKVGSGKTTLVNLLVRAINTPEKSIFIDGVDINRFDLDTLRINVILVNQLPFLFSDTIINNLKFGVDDASEEQIRNVSLTSAIAQDLPMFPNAMETRIGEKGTALSGGQKQRLALARGLLVNPKILILDDSFSSLDSRTEKSILSRLLNHRKYKTNIIISHKIATLEKCDEIIVLEHGKLSQKGSHEELISQKGLYQYIYSLQQDSPL